MASRSVSITPSEGLTLHADLGEPEGETLGTVVFAHGSGSSRTSPRNRHIADMLCRVGLRTVLLDLLTEDEEAVDIRTREFRFDIPLLAGRVVAATDWVGESFPAQPIGLFGASTGAAAALVAAAERPAAVTAVVSRGGRPDLAGEALPRVVAPTLLIVGGRDPEVIDLNRMARSMMRAPTSLHIVPGASHLFEEHGTLDAVALLTAEWFVHRFRDAAT
jgi:putative phosphoribosyl transferase